MSTNLAEDDVFGAHPLPLPGTERRLHAVSQTAPRRKPSLVYGLVAVLGALTIAGAQMGLSILTTQSSYELRSLTTEQRSVQWQKQILQDEVAGLSSPQYLAANAAALGMVTGQAPNYLRLSDGALVGSGKKATTTSSVQALKKAAVSNELLSGIPLVTDPDASLGAHKASEQSVVVNPASPPAIADGLPTPNTH